MIEEIPTVAEQVEFNAKLNEAIKGKGRAAYVPCNCDQSISLRKDLMEVIEILEINFPEWPGIQKLCGQLKAKHEF